MAAKLLSELIEGLATQEIVGSLDREVNEIQFDSRLISHGDAYFALKGGTVDGHKFIQSCIEAGASTIFCEDLPKSLIESITYVRVQNNRQALGIVANNFYQHPSRNFRLVGVTGTNGKTTVATLLYDLFVAQGKKAGLLSTVQNRVLQQSIPSTHTTADALQICKLMRKMADAGCEYCFMEVTSHAIDQHRIEGLSFDCGVFTNFSQDHLDYHGTLNEYRDTKRRFFSSLPNDAVAITNIDDDAGEYMVNDTLASITTYGTDTEAELCMEIHSSNARGNLFNIGTTALETKLVGSFNAYNLTAVYGVGLHFGISARKIADAFSTILPPPGRMQTVQNSKNVNAIVDFAHTPDGLENSLRAVREVMPKRETLVVVVGCGGDRDKDKRSEMGRIAADLADYVIFTADNPRSEDPQEIANQMYAGVGVSDRDKVRIVIDRKQAIAVATSIPKATLLIAGKGHEKFQELAGEKIPFDDVNIVQELLNEK